MCALGQPAHIPVKRTRAEFPSTPRSSISPPSACRNGRTFTSTVSMRSLVTTCCLPRFSVTGIPASEATGVPATTKTGFAGNRRNFGNPSIRAVSGMRNLPHRPLEKAPAMPFKGSGPPVRLARRARSRQRSTVPFCFGLGEHDLDTRSRSWLKSSNAALSTRLDVATAVPDGTRRHAGWELRRTS